MPQFEAEFRITRECKVRCFAENEAAADKLFDLMPVDRILELSAGHATEDVEILILRAIQEPPAKAEGVAMCSNCSGDYEDPDVTNPPAEDEPEPDTGPDLHKFVADLKHFALLLQALGKEQ